MSRHLFYGALAGLGFLSTLPSRAGLPDATQSSAIKWRPWSDSVFAEAKREHKFVLLDLQAVWCHWCHVMDAQTYGNPQVIGLINSRYIAVQVDQDSRPDLANRYEDYGWPATVVYNGDGGEIVKRAGYLPPQQMASMLQAIIDDPTPGPSVSGEIQAKLNGTTSLTDVDQRKLKAQFIRGYDEKEGGWGTQQKFLNWDNVEYCLAQAQEGDSNAGKMARQTLAAQQKLIDPVWGGVDQYSAGDDWDHPHFEKIMQMQAENVRIYAEAYALWRDPIYLATAQKIYGYVRGFLTSPDGVVYVSQDADLVDGKHAGDYFKLDDAARSKLGIPRVDQHIYARENGWFIRSLTTLYAATGDKRYRDEAVRATEWIVGHRGLGDGGFHHGDEDKGALYLGDNLAMGRAFLDLYTITADPKWLERSEKSAAFIAAHFAYKSGNTLVGFATATTEPGAETGYVPQPEFDENVALARFANLLSYYTGNAGDRTLAETAMRYVTSPDLTQARRSSVGGLLQAEDELASAPVHIAIVGKRTDANARQLFTAALAFPGVYRQIEWFDLHESPARLTAVTYPDLPKAAAYLCTNDRCSPPVFAQDRLLALLQRKTPKLPGAP